jgi:hypothetical protein
VRRPNVVIVLALTTWVLGIGISAQQPSSSVAQPARQSPSFRVGVDVVSLNVTVTDGTNHYVVGLEPEDFAVYEDGVKQDLTFFNRRRQPIALSLLLDSSASMEQHMGMLQTAATNFGVFSRICGSLPAPVADRAYGTGRLPSIGTSETRTPFWWSVSLCC